MAGGREGDCPVAEVGTAGLLSTGPEHPSSQTSLGKTEEDRENES